MLSFDVVRRIRKSPLREDKGSALLDQITADRITAAFTERVNQFASSPNLEERASLAWILPATHPELVLPLGYDEMRYSLEDVIDPTLSSSAVGIIDEVASENVPVGQFKLGALLAKSAQYRSRDGIWHDMEGVIDKLLPAEPAGGGGRTSEEWLQMLAINWLQGTVPHEKNAEQSISLPSLWVSDSGNSLLHTATKSVLGQLHREGSALEDIHWRTLEEIVAELLRDLGMEVTITPRSHDGGRDVIARGELIPGEPTLLAVEVKHRKTVPISELRQALWANRHFPALLFVTSGKFSAGVYRERNRSDGRMRLLLKDGYALKQWIDQYVKRNSRDIV